MAFGLMHYGLSTDELLQGTPFKAALEERMHVWDDLMARLTAEGGAGDAVIPGSPLTAHMAGSRGVKYLVNRGPCFTHVDPMHGFLLGLDPVKDSIRTLGRRPIRSITSPSSWAFVSRTATWWRPLKRSCSVRAWISCRASAKMTWWRL